MLFSEVRTMNELFLSSSFFGIVLSLSAYEAGLLLKRKFRLSIFNPLLISIIIVIAVLLLFRIDYSTYYQSSHFLSYLLTPATVSLAIPLYEEIKTLRKYPAAITLGILSGVVTSLTGVFLLSLLFNLSHAEYVTLLPKSITTAVGMPLSEEYGGYVSITVISIIITGVFGNVIASGACRLFRIRSRIAKGVAIGTSCHAIGTTKALEMGRLEGAVSSLSLVASALMTLIGMSIFSEFI